MVKKIILILTAALILFAGWFLLKDPLKRQLFFWQVRIDVPSFTQIQLTKDQNQSSTTEELEATKEDLVVKITKTTISDHKKYIQDRKFILQSLFLPTTSPYPEVITNVLECGEAFKPRLENVPDGTIYTLFAGERLNHGICIKDLVKFKSAYGIFDCQNKGIFEVKVFDKMESDKAAVIAKSFSCNLN